MLDHFLRALAIALLLAHGVLTVAPPSAKAQSRLLGPAFIATSFAIAAALFSALSLIVAWRLFDCMNALAGPVGRRLECLPVSVWHVVENDLFGTSPFLWPLWYRSGSIWLVYVVTGLIAAVCAYGLWYREDLTRTLVLASLYVSFCYSAVLISIGITPPLHRIFPPQLVAFLTYGLLIRLLAAEELRQAFSARRRFLHPLLVLGIPPLTFALTGFLMVMEGLRGLQ